MPKSSNGMIADYLSAMKDLHFFTKSWYQRDSQLGVWYETHLLYDIDKEIFQIFRMDHINGDADDRSRQILQKDKNTSEVKI